MDIAGGGGLERKKTNENSCKSVEQHDGLVIDVELWRNRAGGPGKK